MASSTTVLRSKKATAISDKVTKNRKIRRKLSIIKETEIKVRIPEKIVKRDGRVVDFEVSKIANAIKMCFADIKVTPSVSVSELANRVVNIIGAKYEQPTVEQAQDAVEVVLQAAGEFDAAKHYILYRAEHAKMREKRPIPVEVKEAFALSDQYFETNIQKF